MAPLDGILRRIRRAVRPTQTAGASGTAIFGGYIQVEERSRDLSSREERYRIYADILANTSIVAAGIRYFLNLVGGSEWSFTPTDDDPDSMYAELAERILTEDPETPFHRIIRRTAMYRFYGFSVQEWIAKRAKDGSLTFMDIQPRPQITIEQWDVNDQGDVLGCIQRSPQTHFDLYLPREKLLYIVDDSLNDSPEGLGLFRHLVAPAKRLRRYEQLEGYGFETDLRGIPVGYAPTGDLSELVTAGTIKKKQADALMEPMKKFMRNHVRNPVLGIILDSSRYNTADDAQRPTPNRKWEIELLRGSSTSFEETASAIERLNRELGRLLGVDQLLLGSTNAGSFALARDKTTAFYMLVDSALREIRESVRRDLLGKIWMLNGWPEETIPKITTSAVRFTDVEQIATALERLAKAGAPVSPRDPAISDLRKMMGISDQDMDEVDEMLDAALMMAQQKKTGGDGSSMPASEAA